MNHVNTILLPQLFPDASPRRNKICKRTAKCWLWKLGFRCVESRKGAYIDGHEREDVIEYRKEYLDFFLYDTGIGRYCRFCIESAISHH